jgi:hypothetical protein
MAACELVQRQSGGKSAAELFRFDIDAEGRAHRFVKHGLPSRIAHQAQAAASEKNQPAALPTSSFNLGMTAEQRATKDSMVLPYTRATLAEQQQQAQPEEPKILAPDFDDEDPDEDLDI